MLRRRTPSAAAAQVEGSGVARFWRPGRGAPERLGGGAATCFLPFFLFFLFAGSVGCPVTASQETEEKENRGDDFLYCSRLEAVVVFSCFVSRIFSCIRRVTCNSFLASAFKVITR